VTTPSRVRVTVELQSSYASVDTDGDGQIGLYEWKKAKRPLAQFTQIDANSDGFLTPRELQHAASLPLMATSSSPAAAPSSSPSATAPLAAGAPTATASTPPASPPKAYVSTLSEDDRTKADEAAAKSVFSILDKNRDGKVSSDEMAVSRQMRPLFEQAGINFNEPMPADQFVSNYVRIQKNKRT
jgi:Ca2+-binding EF-hand superfamily protein